MVNELVELLIGGDGIEREDFRKRFQRLLNRVPQRGSTTKPEFSTYFFLGSVLTLPYTKLKDEIGVKASSVKITSKETVKLVFKIEKDGKTKLVFKTITTVERIGNKQYLDINEFKEALGSVDLTQDELNNCEVEGEIVHIKDGKVNLGKLEVLGKGELNSEMLKNLGPLPGYNEETAKFKKVKDGVIGQNSLDGALKEFSEKSLKAGSGEKLSPSAKGVGAFFENLSKVYKSEMVLESDDEDVAKRKLGLSNYEAPMHGFVYGALAMNFRYKYALRIRPEQAAGKGFVDLVVGSNGHEFRAELKGHKNTAQDAKRQSESKGYNTAPMIFSFEEEKKGKFVTDVSANLCLDPSSGGLLVEESSVPPKPKRFIELFNEHSGESLKEKLKEKLNYLYYSISDSNGGGKNTNYLSRLVLGELFADDIGGLLADNSLYNKDKNVFIYEGNHTKPGSVRPGTRSKKEPEDVTTPMNKMISTFALEVKDDKYFILNIIEGEDFKIDKNIPLPEGVDPSQCIQVDIRVNPGASDGFEVESDPEKSYYQDIEISRVTSSGGEHYRGKFEKIEHVDLRDVTDITQVERLGKALFPMRKLIRLENHFQAILQGLLSAQKGVNVLPEPNYSSRGRPDLIVSYDGKTGVVEAKLASTEQGIGRGGAEGKVQIEARGDGLEVYTKEEKVTATVLVVYPNAEEEGKFITYFKADDLTVEHSSRGSSDGEPPAKRRCSGERRKRSIGTCIDSRDEESAEEKKGKEELIKELFDSDEIRERIKNVEFYDQLFKISDQISKEGTISEDAREALMTKVRDIDLDSIDPEVKDIVGNIKEKISGLQINEALEDIFKEPEVAEKIEKVAKGAGLDYTAFLTKDNKIQEYIDKINNNPEVMNHLNRIGKISGGIMQGMMYENLVDDILSGNYEGVAINSGFIAGGPFLGKMAEVASTRGIKFASEGKVILGGVLKAASPFIARATSAFIIYDLVNQVKALKAGNKDALVGVVGDGIYLGVDVVGIGVELAEFAGILEGVSSVTGPIGDAIGVLVLVGTDIYLAVRTVEQEGKIIHLTGLEKFKEGWRAFLHMKPEQHIEDLIEEKEANDQLVRGGIEFLKQHTDIQRYVFPTGKSVVDSCQFVKKRREICGSGDGYLEDDPSRCRSGTGMYNEVDVKECTPPRIQPDLESSVDFVEKMDIFPSRASPDNPEEGELFCLPLNTEPICHSIEIFDKRWGDCQSSNAYRCNSAIGVSYTKDRTGNYTLIALGKGTDVAVGFKGSPNIFLVEDGRKYFEGGDEDDIFVLSGSEITGDLDGGSGDNAIDFGGFRVGQGSLLIDPRLPIDGLEWINMNNILGREGRKDFIYCDHNTKYIDGRGGKDKNAPDNIILHNCTSDHGELTIAVKPYTRVENHLSLGNFTYVIHQGKGNSLIFIAGRGKHSFLFNYTLQNIEAVISYKGSVMFTFSNLNNVSINGALYSDVSCTLSDGTEIRIGNKGGLYALQNTDKQVDEIIKDYPAIANRLNMTITVQSSNESIIIGHGKHEVLHNNPKLNSHLVGNGGENIYVIAPTQKKINIYDVDEESSIDTLDLRDVMKEAQNSSLKVSQSGNDLLIKLEGGESLLKFPIRIKNGTLWYEKLHVVGDSMPMQIKHSGNAWNLSLAPLTFDDNVKIAVITAKDVDEGNKLIVHKRAGQYTFSRLRDDLIIITDPSLGENNACTILLRNFYKEPRMKTLSIKFEDMTILLQRKMRNIGKAVAFCPRVLQMNKEFSVNGSNLLSSYDCLKFNSDKILFLRSGNSLLLLSDKGKLLMSNYYSDVYEKWNLPVELNDDIITSEEFRERANNPSSFRYYQMNDQKALKIYHNQPENKHYVGLVDLKDKSILKCRVRIINNGLILSLENGNFIKVENWVNSESRKIIFVFSDAIVSNEKCIFSTCNPEDIIEEFEKKKVELVNKKGKDINAPPDYVEESESVDADHSIKWLPYPQEERNEESEQRHRRHHIRHENHHRGHRNHRSPIQEATSSAVRPSSWINVFTNTIVDAVKGVSRFISSPFKPAIDMEHPQPSKAITAQGINTNGTLLLLDVFIRKVTGQKYISNNIRSISEQEAQIYALPIAKEFEQALEGAAIESGIPVTNLKFNPVEVFLKVAGQIRSGKFSEISKTLYSSAKEACPEFEQTGKFLVHVKSHLEEFLAKKETVFLQEKQTADQPTSSVSRKVVAMEPSKNPDTFLSDTSVAKGIKHVLGL